MEKNNWKRIIAKEWLFLLGFVASGAAAALLVHLAFSPEPVLDPGPKPTAIAETRYFSGPSRPVKMATFLLFDVIPDTVICRFLDSIGYQNATYDSASYTRSREAEANLGLSDYDRYLLYTYLSDYVTAGESVAVEVLRSREANDYEILVISDWIHSLQDVQSPKPDVLPTEAFAQYRHDRWEDDYRRYIDYSKKKMLAEIFTAGFLILPYPMFVFLRTILWSVRQIRARNS
ncbi:MAG: hypothetical protein AB1483_04200 [Candidatus Zixiibacteriota bacterium]